MHTESAIPTFFIISIQKKLSTFLHSVLGTQYATGVYAVTHNGKEF